MRKLFLLLAISVYITSFAQIDPDMLSLEISKADAANMEQLQNYIWKKASVVTVDGEVKLNTLTEFSFDENGELQMENIDAETTVKQKRGVRGRIQQSQVQDNLEYVEGALNVTLAYTYMTKGQLLDFFGKAEITESNGVIEATAANIYQEGDKLTVRVESDTKLFLSKKFSGFTGEDAVEGEIQYAKFDSGVSHATTFVLNLPGKNALINSVNKDYSLRVQ